MEMASMGESSFAPNFFDTSSGAGQCYWHGSMEFVSAPFDNSCSSQSLGSNNVNGVYVDSSSNIYAATTGGLSISR